MTSSAHVQRTAPSRPAIRRHAAGQERPRRVQGRVQARGHRAPEDRPLASYLDCDGRRREVLGYMGAGGSVLVIDRDCATLGDRRLIAHLGADEPAGNAELVCAAYMHAPEPGSCRRVAAEDLGAVPTGELEALAAQEVSGSQPLLGACGERFELELVDSETSARSVRELRWRRWAASEREPVTASLREVVGSLESYEPARTLTARALLAHGEDPMLSVTALRAELLRLNASRTVLNRGLREAVLARVRHDSLSMSEIALRCDRVKHDSRGGVSGETSWLARRLGLAAEAPGFAPTPWVHSDVLALIARSGLGISPREVEIE